MLAHAVEERDQVELLSSLGYDVFSLGAYEDPANPGDDIRPPLPNAPRHPELMAAVSEHRARMEHDNGPAGAHVDWAKWMLPEPVLDWADTIICHHIEWEWLKPQWPLIRDKRVIWRTVGQSVENNEKVMAPLRADGLQIVRYSPREANVPGYVGADAVIRFWRDPEEWSGWTGEEPVVVNVTQRLKQRDPWTNYRFWTEATAGLPTMPVGEGSEEIGGTGRVSYEDMKSWLRRGRAYLYTGTQPASYTLGLLEALMTGIPVVSIGPKHMTAFPYGPDLFEGHELALEWSDEPKELRRLLKSYLGGQPLELMSAAQRGLAIRTFGRDAIGAQWKAFLG